MRRAAIVALAICALGCGSTFRPFARRPIVWRDDDMHAFAGPPPELYTPWAWDQVDNTIFRQASQVLLYERSREAIDVNALDEVPDSSWYTNRLSVGPMTLDQLRDGACGGRTIPPPPYTILHGKTGGTTPGLLIEASDGDRYVMKTELFGQPERDTAAAAISTRLLFAAGYTVPCNVVSHVRDADFVIAPGATRHPHTDDPFTHRDLERALDGAVPIDDGSFRVSFSRYLPGVPLGGFRFDGTRGDDPNDVVPHQHRRELRALYVMSGWMNHVDVRAENNLDLWIETSEGQGWIRHAILDASDAFGIVWEADLDYAISRRFGNAHYLDLEQVLGDIATLGFAERAYRDPVRGPAWEVLGFFDVERFQPDQWRNNYPNSAFEQRTEADCAWMARIIARMGEPEVRAIVETGRFSRALYEEEAVRILMGRRERILERYLVRLSALTSPEIRGATVCLRDLAIESGLRDPRQRAYGAAAYEGIPPRPAPAPPVVASDGSVCVDVARDREYQVIDVLSRTRGGEVSGPARVHLARDERGVLVIVGLERPGSAAPP